MSQLAAIAMVAAATGCGGEGSVEGQASEYLSGADSSGALVVDWPRLLDPSEPVPFDTLEVVLEIGGSGGEADALFQVSGIARSGPDRWILGQRGEPHLVIVEGGVVTQRIPREGDGPGEFRSMGRLVEAGEGGVVAFAVRRRLFTWIGPDLGLVREVQAPSGAASGERRFNASGSLVVGVLPTEELVLHAPAVRDTLPPSTSGNSVVRQREVLLALDPSGAVRVIVPDVPGRDAIVTPSGGMIVGQDAVFGKKAVHRVAGDRIFSLDTRLGDVTIRDRDGREVRRVSLPPRNAEVTEAEIDAGVQALIDVMLSRGAQVVPGAADALRGLVSPGPAPVLRDFVVSEGGTLWFFFDPVSVPQGAEVVLRVDPGSGGVDRFVGPLRFTPFGADLDRVWGIRLDDFDVEHFVVLRRPR